MKVYQAHIEPPDFADFKTPDGHYDFAAHEIAENKYTEMLQEWARSQEKHPLAGEIIRTPMGDGSACYVLAKVGGSLSLIHLATGDAWHNDQFCRLMTATEAKRMVQGARRMQEIFRSPA